MPAGSGPRVAMSPDLVHIDYRIQGTGDPLVVLVHDWAGSASYWQAQLGPLTEHYTVVTINLAGHGASGRNRSAWTLDAYAQDVATVLKQIPGRPAVLVGHGMGAVVALTAAPLLGTRLLGIIAVDGLQSIGAPPLPGVQIARQTAALRTGFVEGMRARVPHLFPPDADPRLVARVAYDLSLSDPRMAVGSLTAWLAWNPGTSLLQVRVPVLAINSDREPTDTARIRRYLPDFHAEVLPHTGHFLMMEAPARVNPLLLKDIGTLAKRARP